METRSPIYQVETVLEVLGIGISDEAGIIAVLNDLQACRDASTALRCAQHDTQTAASCPRPCHTERSEVSHNERPLSCDQNAALPITNPIITLGSL